MPAACCSNEAHEVLASLALSAHQDRLQNHRIQPCASGLQDISMQADMYCSAAQLARLPLLAACFVRVGGIARCGMSGPPRACMKAFSTSLIRVW